MSRTTIHIPIDAVVLHNSSEYELQSGESVGQGGGGGGGGASAYARRDGSATGTSWARAAATVGGSSGRGVRTVRSRRVVGSKFTPKPGHSYTIDIPGGLPGSAGGTGGGGSTSSSTGGSGANCNKAVANGGSGSAGGLGKAGGSTRIYEEIGSTTRLIARATARTPFGAYNCSIDGCSLGTRASRKTIVSGYHIACAEANAGAGAEGGAGGGCGGYHGRSTESRGNSLNSVSANGHNNDANGGGCGGNATGDNGNIRAWKGGTGESSCAGKGGKGSMTIRYWPVGL